MSKATRDYIGFSFCYWSRKLTPSLALNGIFHSPSPLAVVIVTNLVFNIKMDLFQNNMAGPQAHGPQHATGH